MLPDKSLVADYLILLRPRPLGFDRPHSERT